MRRCGTPGLPPLETLQDKSQVTKRQKAQEDEDLKPIWWTESPRQFNPRLVTPCSGPPRCSGLFGDHSSLRRTPQPVLWICSDSPRGNGGQTTKLWIEHRLRSSFSFRAGGGWYDSEWIRSGYKSWNEIKGDKTDNISTLVWLTYDQECRKITSLNISAKTVGVTLISKNTENSYIVVIGFV